MPLAETWVHCYNVKTSLYPEEEFDASCEVGLELWNCIFSIIDPITKVVPLVSYTKRSTTYTLPQSINYEDLWSISTHSSYDLYYDIRLETVVDNAGYEIHHLHLKWLKELKAKYPKMILLASADEFKWEVIA